MRIYPSDDFEATIRVYSAQEGGRKTPAYNGIRWDFAYADDSIEDGLYCIYPDFMDEQGDSLPAETAIPIGIPLPARMTILNRELRASLHQHRIAPGVKFFCHEGGRRVAEGVVTKITGLLDNAQPPPRATDL